MPAASRITRAALCLATAVIAAPAAAQTCVIVVPTNHPTISEARAYNHEMAHCNGWEDDGSIDPPRRFVFRPKMRLEVNRLPSDVAEQVCSIYGGHSAGCQWFE